MYYHCRLELATRGHHYWWNYSIDDLMSEVIIPMINKQVIPVNYRKGRGILNLSMTTYITVFKTPDRIPADTEEEQSEVVTNIEKKTYEECTQELLDQYLQERITQDTMSTLQNQFTITKKQVFVIMKFDEPFLDSAYQGVIKPIIESNGYHPVRIDEIQDSGRITDQIVEEISKSEVVLADLSGERPNCYYEAGFAHALGKNMIFTVKKGTPVHFDLSAYRFIEWETEQQLRQELEVRFRHIIQTTAG